jgi:hypothetical protein
MVGLGATTIGSPYIVVELSFLGFGISSGNSHDAKG